MPMLGLVAAAVGLPRRLWLTGVLEALPHLRPLVVAAAAVRKVRVRLTPRLPAAREACLFGLLLAARVVLKMPTEVPVRLGQVVARAGTAIRPSLLAARVVRVMRMGLLVPVVVAEAAVVAFPPPHQVALVQRVGCMAQAVVAADTMRP